MFPRKKTKPNTYDDNDNYSEKNILNDLIIIPDEKDSCKLIYSRMNKNHEIFFNILYHNLNTQIFVLISCLK